MYVTKEGLKLEENKDEKKKKEKLKMRFKGLYLVNKDVLHDKGEKVVVSNYVFYSPCYLVTSEYG